MKVVILAMLLLAPFGHANAQDEQVQIFPMAIMPFSERGAEMRGQGKNVSDLIFANLVVNPNVYLVERAELAKVIDELTLNQSGMVRQDQAAKVGVLTGAKILITGSVFKMGDKKFVVAKIIGTETGKVIGESVDGSGDLAELVESLSVKITKLLKDSSATLMPKVMTTDDVINKLKEKLKGKVLPKIHVEIAEEHVARTVIDPAAQTEFIKVYKALGGEVVDNDEGDSALADIKISGEGISEFATNIGRLMSVKARLEIKAVNKEGDVVAVDRRTTVKVDVTELIAGKSALQEGALKIALSMIPKLAKAENDK